MSLEIVLIPIAIALVTAVKAKHDESSVDSQQLVVETRMKSIPLLQRAIGSIGYRVIAEGTELQATGKAGTFRFQKNADDVWVALFSPDFDQVAAVNVLKEIDRAYGLAVQEDVRQKIRTRASSVGMTLESEETHADLSITMTLTVGESA